MYLMSYYLNKHMNFILPARVKENVLGFLSRLVYVRNETSQIINSKDHPSSERVYTDAYSSFSFVRISSDFDFKLSYF